MTHARMQELRSTADAHRKSFFTSPLCSVLAALVSLTAVLLVYRFQPFHYQFWDAGVYAGAIARWRSGGDPYLSGHLLPYIYPPIFVLAGSALESVTGPWAGWCLYIGLSLAAGLAVPALMSEVYARRWWLTWPLSCAIFFAGPRFLGSSTLLGGNISSLCSVAILGAAVLGLRRGEWLYLYAAVAASSCIKISFLCFLLLPLFVADGQALAAAATALAAALVYFVQWKAAPALFTAWRFNVYQLTIHDRSDGFSVFSALRRLMMKLHGPSGPVLPVGGHLAYSGAAITALVVLRHRPRSVVDDPAWLALVLVAAVTCNPRMMDYDAAIAIVPAAALLVDGLSAVRLRTLTTALLSCFLLILVFVNAPMAILAVLLSAALVGYLNLWARYGNRGSEPDAASRDRSKAMGRL